MIVSKLTSIEEIVTIDPELIEYLSKQGIRCIRCGEPVWGSLEDAALQKGYSQEQIVRFVNEMNLILENKGKTEKKTISTKNVENYGK